MSFHLHADMIVMSTCYVISSTCRYDCDEYSPCADEPCLHGGMCNSVDGRYLCECALGYFGKHCEKMDVCDLLAPCGPHTETCRSVGVNGYTCICHEGWLTNESYRNIIIINENNSHIAQW